VGSAVRQIEFYMRVIEKAGATGAVLVSGQAVTLRFPSGDRRSTQITPHRGPDRRAARAA
jgi:hypothetical protein